MPPGASSDLGQFLRVKLAHPVAVEFSSGRKGDVLDVKIEPHANGICGHQIIDIAVLIQSHLRVAGAGRQRPHHNRASALGAPNQFGDGIDVVHREPDNGAAFGHPADLL